MNTCVFDVESCAPPDDILLAMRPEFKPAKNLKDPEKIAADIAEKEAAWKADAALSALTAQIVLIGMDIDGEYCPLAETEERITLQMFWNKWNAGGRFIGFGVKFFDMRMILQRSWILGVPVPKDVMSGRYFSLRIIDLHESWNCFLYGQYASLDAVSKAIGLGSKAGTGAEFGKLWLENKPAAIDYNRRDVALTKAVAQRLGIL